VPANGAVRPWADSLGAGTAVDDTRPGAAVRRTVSFLAASVTLFVAVEAAAARVLLLDSSEQAGNAERILDDAAEVLQKQYRVSAVGPSFATPYTIIAAPSERQVPVEWLVERAQREFENFELETAHETLGDASHKLEELTDGESGELLLKMHWLYAQLAIVRGEDDLCALHLEQIAGLAPWWEPPVGYLTPELRDIWLAERQRVMGEGVRVQVNGLPPGTRAWIDGFELTEGQTRALAPGRHLYHAERPGFVPARQWVRLKAGQRWEAVAPVHPAWDDATRAQVREAVHGPIPEGVAEVLAAMGALAGVDLVVVAYRTAADPPGTVRAAAVTPGQRSWTVAHRTCSSYDLAEQAAGAVGGAAVAPGGGASKVSPLLTVELGGGARLVGPAEQWVVGGGGPALELGGGVSLAGHLELRAAVGLAFAGPSALALGEDFGDAEVRQRAYLFRVGGLVAPHIPLGGGSTLWFGGGGGFLVTGVVTAVGNQPPYPAEERGACAFGGVGIDLPVRPGLTVGPSVSYTHGFVPVTRSVPVEGQRIEVETTAARSLQFQVRITLGVMR